MYIMFSDSTLQFGYPGTYQSYYSNSSYLNLTTFNWFMLPFLCSVSDTTSSTSYFPHADGSKVQVDCPKAFERFTQWSPEEKQKEVKLSFGAVKPLEGLKNVSVASSYDMKSSLTKFA